MVMTQEQKKELFLVKYMREKAKKLSDEKFYGKLVIEFRGGRVYQVKTEQIEDIEDLVRKSLIEKSKPELTLKPS